MNGPLRLNQGVYGFSLRIKFFTV